jgi:hypothetical protein
MRKVNGKSPDQTGQHHQPHRRNQPCAAISHATATATPPLPAMLLPLPPAVEEDAESEASEAEIRERAEAEEERRVEERLFLPTPPFMVSAEAE